MLKRFFQWLFGEKPGAIAPVKPERRGLFSTHLERGDLDDPLAPRLEDVVFRVKPGRGLVPVTAATGHALDSADGSCGGDLAGAFSLADNTGVPDGQIGWFASQGFPGHQILATMAQQWLVAKAVGMPPRDAMRNGYALKLGDGTEEIDAEVGRAIEDWAKKFRVAENAVEHALFNRVFGIRITMFLVDVDDPVEYYRNPFNPDAVRPGSYRGMTQIDPYWCAPELSASAASNPTAQDFYVPTWWNINGMRIHRTHLVISRGEPVADILKPTYLFGGISVVQRIYERVYAAERTANEAPQLAMTKRLRTLKTDLSKGVAKQADLEFVLAQRAQLLSNYGTDVIDKETDDVVMFDTALGDLDSVIMTQYQIVAAIAECPATKLLGTTPKGFNATGEYEESSYHETLRSLQSSDLQPILDRHHTLLMRSEIAPKFGLKPTTAVTVIWNPLDTPTAREAADTQFVKAQTAKLYVDSGALDAYDLRDALIADRDSGFSGLESVERPEETDEMTTPETDGDGPA